MLLLYPLNYFHYSDISLWLGKYRYFPVVWKYHYYYMNKAFHLMASKDTRPHIIFLRIYYRSCCTTLRPLLIVISNHNHYVIIQNWCAVYLSRQRLYLHYAGIVLSTIDIASSTKELCLYMANETTHKFFHSMELFHSIHH